MKVLLQSALLAFVVISLIAVVLAASKDEFGDVFDGGKLSRFCRKHLETCSADNVKESLHALHNLEVVQGDLITWRTHWIASTFVALTLLVVAFACGVSVGCVTVLALAAFFATSFAFHHQHSWYSGHISKHTRDARTQCIQRLQGNPSLEYSYYAKCFLAGFLFLVLLICFTFVTRAFPGKVTPLEENFHVLYINLDADVDRRERYSEDMQHMYPDRLSLERIPGVQHSWGLEGCRLAHLKALSRALEFDAEYVLVTEDDVIASDSKQALRGCLREFVARVTTLESRRRPAMLLLECGQDLEKRIRLCECRGGPNFRRVLFGGNNAGAYLIRRDFIPRLRALWGCARGIHIDFSWQLLWPFYDVWMAFPPPLKQRSVWSHNLKEMREECKKFDTDLYFATNRFL